MARFWFSRAEAIQCKAIALMALLAGHEAVRLTQHTDDSARQHRAHMASSAVTDQNCGKKPMCTQDQQCTVAWNHRCAEDTKCEWQWLPGDNPMTPSQSCRISPDTMLEEKDEYLGRQFELLLVKTRSLATECSGKVGVWNLRKKTRCSRREVQVTRALNVLTAMEASQEQKQADGSKFERLIDAVIDSVEPGDKPDIEKVKKLITANSDLQTNPEAFGNMIEVLYPFFGGTDAEKAVAKNKIAEMEAGKVRAEGTDSFSDTTPLPKPEEFRNFLRECAEANGPDLQTEDETVAAANGTTPGSLVERAPHDWGANMPTAKRVGFVLLSVIVVALVLTVKTVVVVLALTALASVGYCGFQAKQDKDVDFMKCAKQVFKYPFKLLAKAGKWTFQKLWKNNDNPNIPTPQRPQKIDYLKNEPGGQ